MKTLEKILSVVGLAGALAACGADNGKESCTKDTDCREPRVCDSDLGYCVDADGGSSGSSSGGSQEYTCESGSQMVVEVCCEATVEGCSKEFKSQWYHTWLEECLGLQSAPQQFFKCTYDYCSTAVIEGAPNYGNDGLNECEQKYFK
ncbi:MAG: hypothetical protein AB1668_06145 [Nanoarchaeota archaeon]